MSEPSASHLIEGSGADYDDTVQVTHLLAAGTEDWHRNAVMALRAVFDPEIPLNIYDLGLIYQVQTLPMGMVKIVMTLTSPSCPEAEAIPARIEFQLRELPDTRDVEVELTWDDPWTPERMSEAARLELGFY